MQEAVLLQRERAGGAGAVGWAAKEGPLALSVGVGLELTKFFVAPDSQVARVGRALHDTAIAPWASGRRRPCAKRTRREPPAIHRRLAADPRFVLHLTPTSSSWLNLVERWFAELTNKKLRRGAHRSVHQLNSDIRAWIDTCNENPRPFVWTKP
jgi:hypothetical protein